MSIYVQPTGRAKDKVLAALTELNLLNAELVFMDCPNAQEIYPELNIVNTVELSSLEKPEWLETLKTALHDADAVLFFLSTNRNNIGTCHVYRSILHKDKLMWIYDTQEANLANNALDAEKAQKYIFNHVRKIEPLLKKVLSITNDPKRPGYFARTYEKDARSKSEAANDLIRVASILEMLEKAVEDIQDAKYDIHKLKDESNKVDVK